MLIDLAEPQFWAVLAAAVVLLTPIVNGELRRWVLAVVNASFLVLLLRSWTLVILAGVLVAQEIGQRIHRRKGAGKSMLLGAARLAVIGLFVYHKCPALSDAFPLAPLSLVLAVVGFSYVALRLIDFMRTMSEKRAKPPGFAALLNYLFPFHMLAAGPIQSFTEFAAQPATPDPIAFEDALQGIGRIAQGLFKKYVLAYCLIQLTSTAWQSRGAYALLEMNFHYLWLYLDFSGYSDIAVGVGILIGVATPENFNRPYLARNMTDFWQRWHISLSQFVRRNIFMPIQLALVRGNYNPVVTASLALGVSFLIVGLWHGVTLPWFLWGMMHAGGVILSNLYREFLKRKLSAEGLERYNASLPIRLLSTFVTTEFVALSLVLVGNQWHSAWN
jgi:D-alanyl-lipoteichoic acid acyltransferase DltB (MBOAT superfamily)